LVKFRKWDEILKSPEPEKQLALANSMWHWVRAMAYAGKGQVPQAVAEQALFTKQRKGIMQGSQWGLNSTDQILDVAGHMLNGKLARAQKNTELAVKELQEAVAGEDALAYDEPPAWFLPARESLGGAYLSAGKSADAERVFREDLKRNARNGRSLFGLMESLKGQGKTDAALMVERRYQSAWKDADSKLSIDGL
jgi:tetratricopeptide (TPR) repeat protein